MDEWLLPIVIRSAVEEAKRFCELKCWEWMEEEDLFGIKFPDIDEIFFCSVIGHNDLAYGILIYEGRKGLQSFLDLYFEKYDIEEGVIRQDTIVVFFNNREELTKEDYELVKQSGVHFRGRNVWPSFHLYEPGFLERVLNEDELFLAERVLRAAEEFVLYLEEHPDKKHLSEEGKCCVREYQTVHDFKEYVVSFEDVLKRDGEHYILAYSELELEKVKRICKPTNAEWEIDLFYMPTPVVEDDDRVCFPPVSFIVDAQTESILGFEVNHPYEAVVRLQKFLLNTCRELEILPKALYFSDEDLVISLSDICLTLNIEVYLGEKLNVIPQIKESFYY